MPSFRRRVDSFYKEMFERPVWPPLRPHLDFDDGDFEQEKDAQPEPPRRRKNARCRVNLFIDAEAGVDKEASRDEQSEDKMMI